MLEIERHIERLLLDSDCLIVPGLGGFVVHHSCAIFNSKRNTFSPPKRILGFDNRLSMSDSVLAQSIVDHSDLSIPEAMRSIEQDVDELRRRIEETGKYTISGIGTLRKSAEVAKSYDFTPCSTSFVSPALYGLSDIEAEMLQTECQEESVPVFEAETEQLPSGKKHISVNIPENLLHQICAVGVALLIFVLFPSQVGKNTKQILSQYAVDTDMLYRIMPNETKGGMQSTSLVSAKLEGGEKPEIGCASVKEKDEQVKCNPVYTIVLASRVTRKNAEVYVEELHKKGLADASVYVKDGKAKVIYKHYNSKADAYAALNDLGKQAEFEGCWITEIYE